MRDFCPVSILISNRSCPLAFNHPQKCRLFKGRFRNEKVSHRIFPLLFLPFLRVNGRKRVWFSPVSMLTHHSLTDKFEWSHSSNGNHLSYSLSLNFTRASKVATPRIFCLSFPLVASIGLITRALTRMKTSLFSRHFCMSASKMSSTLSNSNTLSLSFTSRPLPYSTPDLQLLLKYSCPFVACQRLLYYWLSTDSFGMLATIWNSPVPYLITVLFDDSSLLKFISLRRSPIQLQLRESGKKNPDLVALSEQIYWYDADDTFFCHWTVESPPPLTPNRHLRVSADHSISAIWPGNYLPSSSYPVQLILTHSAWCFFFFTHSPLGIPAILLFLCSHLSPRSSATVSLRALVSPDLWSGVEEKWSDTNFDSLLSLHDKKYRNTFHPCLLISMFLQRTDWKVTIKQSSSAIFLFNNYCAFLKDYHNLNGLFV